MFRATSPDLTASTQSMAALVEEYAAIPDYFAAERAAVGRLLDREPRPDAVIGVCSDSGHNVLAARCGSPACRLDRREGDRLRYSNTP